MPAQPSSTSASQSARSKPGCSATTARTRSVDESRARRLRAVERSSSRSSTDKDVDALLPRQAEHALADHVPHDVVRAAPDEPAERVDVVVHPEAGLPAGAREHRRIEL